MRTGVQEDVDLVVRGPGDDHLLFAHARAHEVARLGDLALVAHEQPHPREDLLQLLLVNVRVAEDGVVNRSVGRVDESTYRVICSDHAYPLSVLPAASLLASPLASQTAPLRGASPTCGCHQPIACKPSMQALRRYRPMASRCGRAACMSLPYGELTADNGAWPVVSTRRSIMPTFHALNAEQVAALRSRRRGLID